MQSIKQVQNYLDYCQNICGMSKKTIVNKRQALFNFIKDSGCKDLRKLDNKMFNDWIQFSYNRGVNPNTINDYMDRILAMIRYYREMGLNIPLKLPLIPKIKEEPRRRVFYSKQDIDNVLKTADEIPGLMIRISFDTGMRLSELANLRLSNFKERKVTYIGKGNRMHIAYLKQETYDIFRKYIKKYDIDDFLWHENNKNSPLSSQTVSKYMTRQFNKCGYNDFHPHALRHSFATNLQKQGASIEEIQHMIGHSSASITELYLHGFDELKMKMLFDESITPKPNNSQE